MSTTNRQCCVVVHVGAGYHSEQNAGVYKKAMKMACIRAMGKLKQGANANDAVECAVAVLEDAPITNAGVGSNLNRAGLVECDAAIMCSSPDAFGAVGAVSAICNPIKAANAILKSQARGPDAHGLVPPMMLVGEGADSWAQKHGVETNYNTRHKITEKALSKYAEYMERINSSGCNSNTPTDSDQDLLMDTVGAVCIDSSGVVSAGVSSGGIALKYPGRVGEAAMFGAGCWAEKQRQQKNQKTDNSDEEVYLTGCSVTGTGEQIMRTLLAKDCAQRHGDMFSILSTCFDSFHGLDALSSYQHKSAGLILLQHDMDSNRSELGIAHTTHSMGYGYMTSDMNKPLAKISRNPDDAATTTMISAIRL